MKPKETETKTATHRSISSSYEDFESDDDSSLDVVSSSNF